MRGAGIFGNFFFTYGDDKKLIFYKEKEEEKMEKGGLSEVEKFQNEMVEENGVDLVMSRGNKLRIGNLRNGYNPFDSLDHD